MKKRIPTNYLGLLLFAYVTLMGAVSFGQTLYISEVMTDNDSTLADEDGTYSDWIELHNPSSSAASLDGWYLSDDEDELTKWKLPNTTIAANGFLVVFASSKDRVVAGSELHTNFKLSASGEALVLTRPDGTTLEDEFVLPAMNSDAAYGYAFTDGIIDPSATGLLIAPTPWNPNTNISYIGQVQTPTVTPDRGFYDAPFQVTVSNSTAGATIRYTLDGSTPTESSPEYTGPVTISSTTCFRVGAFVEGWNPSYPRTDTYLFVEDVTVVPQSISTNNSQVLTYGMDPAVVSKTYMDASNQVVTVQDALKAIPSISITTDYDNLYDPTSGIYVNPLERWEVPASAELINPDGSKGFHINMGLRLRGGASRRPSNPKHSFRLFFRGEYGAGKLNYPLFEDEGAEEFDKIDLRSAQNYSWSKDGDTRNTFLRDVFARDSALAMGQENPRSRYYHLYLNGEYWGLFMTEERPVASYGESYFGGDKDDYDAIKVISWTDPGAYSIEATDGTTNAYYRLYSAAMAGFTNNVDYFSVQGLDANGDADATNEKLLDVENMIDYLLVIYHMAASDNSITSFVGGYQKLNNMYAIYNRVNPDGFKWIQHDSEHALDTCRALDFTGPFLHNNFTLPEYFNPMTLHEKLSENEEYKLKFADRVYKHYKNDGAMVLTNSQARLDYRAAQIDRAIVANAARWGSTSLDRDTWVDAAATSRDWLARSGDRCDEVIGYLQADGLIPIIEPPQFSRSGGLVSAGTTVSLSLAEVVELIPPSPSTPYYGTPMAVPGLVEVEDFDHGGQGVAYSDTDGSRGDYRPAEDVDLEECDEGGYNMGWAEAGEWMKYTVNVAAAGDHQIRTRVAKKSGTAAYHIEVNDMDVTGTILVESTSNWQSWADSIVNIGLTNGIQVVKLVIESSGLNINYIEFSDLGTDTLPIVTPEPIEPFDSTIYYTIDGTDPRAIGGGISGVPYGSAISITKPTHLKARCLTSTGAWSALADATFWTPEIPLAVTELMYHAPDGNAYDFIEIQNVSDETVSLKGYKLDNAVDFKFKNAAQTTLAAGEYLVVVDDMDYFNAAYPAAGINIAGEFSGDFSNGGEQVDLEFRDNDLVSFTYSDARNWPQAADGAGHSLVPLDQAMDDQEQGSLDYGGNWRASTYLGGSPGTADPQYTPTIVLNEIMAHTDTGLAPPYDSNDQIELYNTSDSPVTLSGWYLSDALDTPNKWLIPDTTILGNGFVVFDESDFHFSNTNGFGLNKAGEQVVLSAPGRVVDAVRFKGQENVDTGVSWGRYPDGSDNWITTTPTDTAPNQPATATVQISEIMYNPVLPGNDFEYLQLKNMSPQTVNFETTAGTYRLDGGVEFDFPLGTSLSADETLWILSFNPTNTVKLNSFCTYYGLNVANETFMGGYSGSLSDRGERVALERPQDSDDPLLPFDVSWVVVDEVFFFDQAPWPTTADGAGNPLIRTGLSSWDVPFVAAIGVSESAFHHLVRSEQTLPDDTVEIWNSGLSILNYSISTDVSWLSASPSSGSSTGEQVNVTLSYDLTGLAAGTHSGHLKINSTNAYNAPRFVEVILEVYEPELDHLSWESVETNQSVNVPFEASLTAFDQHGLILSSFTNSVSLSAVEGGVLAPEVQIGTGTEPWKYPLSTYYHDARTQVIYLQSELGAACKLNSLALNVSAIPGQILENWTIRLRHSSLDSYGSSPEWENTWTTVYQNDETISTTGWMVFEFNTPFEYDGMNHLMVDFSHNNSSWTTDGTCLSTDMGTPRALYDRTDSNFGDPLDWNGSSSPTPSIASTVPNIKLGRSVDNFVSISPTTTGNFVQGIWSGTLTVTEAVSNLVLHADDGAGYTVESNPFNVVANLSDQDGDGIPDTWEVQFFSGPTNAMATGDADHDGQSNLQEYIAGMDPTNAASCFAAELDTQLAAGFVVNWTAVTGRVYDVLWAPDLMHGFQILEPAIPYPVNSYTDRVHSVASAGYYLVTVHLPSSIDSDGDGLPDAWESQFFNNPTFALAAQDADSDGQSNVEEYLAGTNPTNTLSRFKIDILNTNTIYWAPKSGRTYSVFWTDDLAKPFTRIASGLSIGSYTDSLHADSSANYYQIYVEMD